MSKQGKSEISYRLPLEVDLNKVKFLRTKMGLTQRETADKLGISAASTYGAYEQGYRSMPHDVLQKLADLFGVSPMDLIVAPVSNLTVEEENSPSTIMAGLQAMELAIRNSYEDWYKGLDDELIKQIVNMMRENLYGYFRKLECKFKNKYVWDLFGAFLVFYKIFPTIATMNLVDALTDEERGAATKRTDYINTSSPREVSLLYHVVQLVDKPFDYMLEINSIPAAHCTPYVSRLIQHNPDFIFPPVGSVLFFAEDLKAEEAEMEEWLEKHSCDNGKIDD